MSKLLLAGALILSFGAGLAAPVAAQYGERDRPGMEGPSVFDWFDRNRQGRNLVCTSSQRVDRRGDIRWIRLDCNAR